MFTRVRVTRVRVNRVSVSIRVHSKCVTRIIDHDIRIIDSTNTGSIFIEKFFNFFL